jgi:hypothetical protein
LFFVFAWVTFLNKQNTFKKKERKEQVPAEEFWGELPYGH